MTQNSTSLRTDGVSTPDNDRLRTVGQRVFWHTVSPLQPTSAYDSAAQLHSALSLYSCCHTWLMTTTRRVVPIITVEDIDTGRDHYVSVLGLSEVMNHGWIVTLADGSGRHQVSLMTKDPTASVNPSCSVEVDDVDAAYQSARGCGLEIVHELQDEAWQVRRFFFRDTSGNVINVLSHRQ